MLSVIIETKNDEDRLARTLAALVGGAVEGVVREVLVCDRGSTDRTGKVADHAGCVWLQETGIDVAVRRAKGDWLMFLEPGARPIEGWIEAASAHVANHTHPGRFTSAEGRGLVARILLWRRPLAEGLLISKQEAASVVEKSTTTLDLASAVAPRRIDGQIYPAPAKR